MPLTANPGPKHRGWWRDQINGRLYMVYDGVKVAYLTAAGLVYAFAQSVTGGITAVTGDIICTAGNLRLGAISAFASTEPTSAVVMKAGTAPAGAITTSGGVFASATVVRKIIADGTVSNVET